MGKKHCAACGILFQQHPQVPSQSYCSHPECQRERRRRWQRDKLKNDSDYRDNQARAQRTWLDRNPDYWREYRAAHPDYTDHNRKQQRVRAEKRKTEAVAKMDVPSAPEHLPSGIYRIRRIATAGSAKMDAWTVEITLLSSKCPCESHDCKEMT